ncbi:MAG TPA: hypothetical protein VK540_10885 [Polyangiaceae bacterium]|nr:hypothetical protein [Polyangiaceae bacterium]
MMRNHRSTNILGGLLAIAAASAVSAACSGDDDVVDPPTTTAGGAGGTGATGGTGGSTGGTGGGDTGGSGGTTGGSGGTTGGSGGSTGGAGGSGGSDTDGGGTGGTGGGDTDGGGGTAGSGGSGGGSDGGPLTTVTINDNITTDTTWTADNEYVLGYQKQIFVKNGATLTIQPGTTVLGDASSVLTVTRGSKLLAVGTKEKPIVFSSKQPAGQKTPGFWGGLIILGRAPVNVNKPGSNEAVFEAFTSAADDGKFGGDDPHDNSGILRYLRLEFGGFAYATDREFNNITLCGVGDGTAIDYVQTHHGRDDGIELFGGTVNVKHILSSQNEDDGFDTDNGWQGKGQFIIIQSMSPAGTDPSNGYESDNHATATSYTTEPRTKPTLYNVTLLGKKDYAAGSSFAAIFRRGTQGNYHNHLFMSFPQAIEVRDQASADAANAGDLFIKNSIFFQNGTDNMNFPATATTPLIDERAVFMNAAWSNREVDPGLPAGAFSLTAPSFKPNAGSAALTGGAAPPDDMFFDPTATFVGAIGADDWTQGWTAYPQPGP